MTVIWLVSACVFAFALWVSGSMAVIRRDFQLVCSCLAIVGLAATFRGQVPDWCLLWYTPAAIVGAYLFALRHLLALSQRLDEINRDSPRDLESLRSEIEQAVGEYNEQVDDEQRLK